MGGHLLPDVVEPIVQDVLSVVKRPPVRVVALRKERRIDKPERVPVDAELLGGPGDIVPPVPGNIWNFWIHGFDFDL